MNDNRRMRTLAGCIPYRLTDGQMIICLINSRHDPRILVFPKGGIERGETEEEASMRETFEEAGLNGVITGRLGKLGRCHWFMLRVEEELDAWPEVHQRRRHWMSIYEAKRRHDLSKVAADLVELMQGNIL